MPKVSVFVCYRREDSAGYSGWLAESLRRKYGATRVFFDVHIAGGADFQREIERAVTGCGVVLALIGRRWLVDAAGRQRLDDAQDFVRLELASALRAKRPIIPVLVDGGTLPQPEQLPEVLRPLLDHQAMELSNVRWQEDLARIESAIDQLTDHAGSWWRRPRARAHAALLVALGVVLSWHAADRESDQRGTDAGARGTAVPAPAAALAGTWFAHVHYSWGLQALEQLELRVLGNGVTGSISFAGSQHPQAIQAGRVEGEHVSFMITRSSLLHNELREDVWRYGGKLLGPRIEFVLDTPANGQTRFVAARSESAAMAACPNH